LQFGSLGLVGALQGAASDDPLALKQHFPAKAKHVIFLFANGGMSR
jgi:hypothetical protein